MVKLTVHLQKIDTSLHQSILCMPLSNECFARLHLNGLQCICTGEGEYCMVFPSIPVLTRLSTLGTGDLHDLRGDGHGDCILEARFLPVSPTSGSVTGVCSSLQLLL